MHVVSACDSPALSNALALQWMGASPKRPIKLECGCGATPSLDQDRTFLGLLLRKQDQFDRPAMRTQRIWLKNIQAFVGRIIDVDGRVGDSNPVLDFE